MSAGSIPRPTCRVATHSHELNDFCAATDASPRTGSVALGAVSPGSERTLISTRHPPRGRAPGCMLRLFAERAAIFIAGLRIDRALNLSATNGEFGDHVRGGVAESLESSGGLHPSRMESADVKSSAEEYAQK